MPYIPDEKRLEALQWPANAGELNYLFTMAMQFYIRKHGLRYESLNACLGALEGAKMELYRRIVVPYEDMQKKKNGDVYYMCGGAPFPEAERDEDNLPFYPFEVKNDNDLVRPENN